MEIIFIYRDLQPADFSIDNERQQPHKLEEYSRRLVSWDKGF